MWDALPNDVQCNVFDHAFRTPLQLQACLVDLSPPYTSVKFLSLRGHWLPTGEFACVLDLNRVPAIEDDDDTGSHGHNWMDFKLRQRLNGTLVLSNMEDVHEWIEIGKVCSISYPRSTWHGVLRSSSSFYENYNCYLFDNIKVYEESEDFAPVYFRLLHEHEVTHMMSDAPFNPDNLDAYFNKEVGEE